MAGESTHVTGIAKSMPEPGIILQNDWITKAEVPRP